MRGRLGDLRQQVEAHNGAQGVPASFVQVVMYAGQCLVSQGDAEEIAK